MAELDDLIAAAKKADRQDRIAWRDPIAAFGLQAVPSIHGLIAELEFGAFAVRVLEKIAEQPASRRAAIEALASIDPSAVSASVGHDVLDALARLGHAQAKASKGVGLKWAGYEAAPPLEQRFHEDMLNIFTAAGEATRKQRSDGSYIRGYWASYFLRAVRNGRAPWSGGK